MTVLVVGAFCQYIGRALLEYTFIPASKMSETDAAKPAEVAAPAAEKPADDGNILKTTVKTNYEDVKKNNKFDPSVREVTDDPDAIRKQVGSSCNSKWV